jgi:hypothetical protein
VHPKKKDSFSSRALVAMCRMDDVTDTGDASRAQWHTLADLIVEIRPDFPSHNLGQIRTNLNHGMLRICGKKDEPSTGVAAEIKNMDEPDPAAREFRLKQQGINNVRTWQNE